MKAKLFVIGLLFLAFVACTSRAKVAEHGQSEEGTNPELSAIDSLMWRQPDSALAVLQQFAASPKADSLDELNGHYCQLLISELLYKNYYGQTNREELLKAMAYFDSLCNCTGVARNSSAIAFLDARAHYINGVGYYEHDSVVEACKEYLKALEVMEGHFQEKELTSKRAQFMANTNNRLGDLFSKQFMMESALKCYENALVFCIIEPTSPIGVSNILYRIGKQYNKLNEIEKARQYYGQALKNIADIDNSVYRDIVSSKALCDYLSGSGIEEPLKAIRNIANRIETENEQLNRYLTIGGIFFHEGIYDSALFYLEPVFENNEAGLQAQAAGYLRIIYDSIGDVEKSNMYMRFLTNQKKSDGENKALVSKLEDLYKDYSNQKKEKEAEKAQEKSIRKTVGIVVPISMMIALTVFIVVKLRSKKLLKKQQEEAARILGETEQELEKELRLWQAEAGKTLKETKKKYEEDLRQLKADTEQQLEEVERKHQQWMTKTKERHEEELREQKDQSKKEIEKTKKRHKEELEAERLAYQAELAEKEAESKTERRLHEETLKRHQVEAEQRMSEAKRRHQQKIKEIAQKYELEMKVQQDKNKKEAEQTRKRHEAELETERLVYQQEQEALRQSLRRCEEQVIALEKKLSQQREVAELRRESFLKESVCRKINDCIRNLYITAREGSKMNITLSEVDATALKEAVLRHYPNFETVLLSKYPKLGKDDLLLCYLYLLGMDERQIAALMCKSYSAIKKRSSALKGFLALDENLSNYILKFSTFEGRVMDEKNTSNQAFD